MSSCQSALGACSPAAPSAGVSASTTVLLAAARRRRIVMMLLAVCAVTACLLYQFAFVNPRFFDYAMSLRLPRLAGIVTASPSRVPRSSSRPSSETTS